MVVLYNVLFRFGTILISFKKTEWGEGCFCEMGKERSKDLLLILYTSEDADSMVDVELFHHTAYIVTGIQDIQDQFGVNLTVFLYPFRQSFILLLPASA